MTVASRATDPDIEGSSVARSGVFVDKSGCTSEEETAMADQPDQNTEKSEMRVMWIGSLAIVLLLLGAMGINMLMTHNTSTGTVGTTGQSGTPPK
jgi:hypothetical protein